MIAKKQHTKQQWEDADFPILCETCLGDNPFVRMMKVEFDKECKICNRPFSVFRWKPGKDARYKKTEICQLCAKAKNVCQTCLLDLEFGLPVQVRDTVLGISDPIGNTTSEAHREFQTMLLEKELNEGGNKVNQGRVEMREALIKLARTSPYYKRNQAHICSFFLKGECKRGDECPYRHEFPPEKSELSNQNIRDRYRGTNDPVAKKILNKLSASKLTPPADKSITTLWIGGVRDPIKETDLKDSFYKYGEITEIRIVPQSMAAYVTFAKREEAEKAAEALYNNLHIRDIPLRISWSKPSQPSYPIPQIESAAPVQSTTIPSQPPPQQQQQYTPVATNNFFNLPTLDPKNYSLPTRSGRTFYPSMDPSRIGGRRDH